MRSFYSIRSHSFGIILATGSLAAVVALMSFFIMQIPARAAEAVPLDHGYVVKHLQPVDVSVVAFDVLPVAEVDRLDDRAGALLAVAELYPLKPEYAESYQTNGLNFIDVRRRC